MGIQIKLCWTNLKHVVSEVGLFLCVPIFDMCLMWLSCCCALTGKVANYTEVASCLFGFYLSTFMEMWMTQGKVSHWSVFNCALDLSTNMWILGFLTVKCETGLQSIGLMEWLENCTYAVQFESHSFKGNELRNDWRIAPTQCCLKVIFVRVVNWALFS